MLAATVATGAAAQDFGLQARPTLNFAGVTGLIDMPSAQMMPDGEVTFVSSAFGPVYRNTGSFQITPWMQGSFRYTGIKGLTLGGFGPNDTYFDRSFDLRLRVLREGEWWPSVTVGLQDFVGTGNFSGEYVVATKHFGGNVRVTAGLGWGRLGTYKPIGSPTGARPPINVGTGGRPNFKTWFRGPAAPFGGIEWQPNERLGLKVEYSSDAYGLETGQGLFNRRSPLNFGVEYQVNDALRLGGYYLYGSTVGVMAQIALNPRRKLVRGVAGPGPRPVAHRPARATNPAVWATDWAPGDGRTAAEALRPRIEQRLKAEGLQLESLAVSTTRVELRIRNLRYDAPAQAIGRAARVLSASLPATVEVFDIVPVENGIALSRISLNRGDLEALEYAGDNAAALRSRVTFSDAAGRMPGAVHGEGLYPRLSWQIGPYLTTGLFDPDSPFRADVGLRFSGKLDLAPGFSVSGSVTQRIAGNLSKYNRVSNSVLPRVRTEDYLYARRSTALERLTLDWYARPGRDIYSRVTAGYLERGYGGVSAEVLWKPVDSRLALGAEVNYVKQRSFTSAFGFGNYSVATGHVSAYYAVGNGYHAQLDVGRYLAGDVGATLSLDREFANGWRVGAFATLTNVSAARFGEGSFDKGIRVTIPLNWVTSMPTRSNYSTTIRPVQRDGGARLNVDGRLYETVRGHHQHRIDDQWGRVWR